jgi:hypothetical protein
MSELLAADYAWHHPDPAAIRAAGYTAVIRYVSTDPAKDLTPQEASALHAAQLGVGLVYETTAQRAYGSSAAGQQDGAAMLARLRELGAPAATPALVNIGDWAVLPQQVGAIESYYAAYREQLAEHQPGAGGYGTAGIITYLAASYPHDIWWQNAIDDLGKSGSVVSQAASIYQRIRPLAAIAGGQYDENVYGFGPRPSPDWWGPGTPVQPAPQPAPSADWWPRMPEISQGSSGAAVRTLQGLLVARYFHIGTSGQAGDGIDGSFGPLCNAAVRTFQGQHGLRADGIVGAQTWPALAGVS